MEGASFITPIQLWDTIGGMDDTQAQGVMAAGAQATLFKDIFKNAIDEVKTTQYDVEHKQYLLATGQLDDAHTLPIAEAKAGLSLDILITFRNKTLESYNELMKMSV